MIYRVGLPFWKLAARWGAHMTLLVRIGHDEEAGVYYAESPDLPGLVVEAPTLDALRIEARLATMELLAEHLGGLQPHTTPELRFSDTATSRA